MRGGTFLFGMKCGTRVLSVPSHVFSLFLLRCEVSCLDDRSAKGHILCLCYRMSYVVGLSTLTSAASVSGEGRCYAFVESLGRMAQGSTWLVLGSGTI